MNLPLASLPLVLIAVLVPASPAAALPTRTNLLIITVDDMSADSVGAFGCPLAGTTPRVDRLAQQGFRFARAHVQVANCMPSRNVMWSGRYPHNNRVEGFYPVPDPGYPVLVDLMKGAGFFTAIRHKVSHSTPYHPYGWDLDLDRLPNGGRADIKEAASYGVSTARAIRAAEDAGKPFCLMINVSDPHKPFYAEGRRGETVPDPNVPSRVYAPEEVPIPGFLFDDPVVRKELSHYYSSVRRADDGVGAVLDALDAARLTDRTVILFLSDHGMPLPFAKTQLYHHSTHTPLIIRWPGVTRAGSVDERHMVSAVDLLPTVLDMFGIRHPSGLDGRSFISLLRGEEAAGWDRVFKEYNENSGGSRDPMRAVQTPQFLYLYNPWSDGKSVMRTATQGTSTYRRMKELALTDPAIAARLDLVDHRVPEELYNIAADPDARTNLAGNPDYQAELATLRHELEDWMVRTRDPLLEVFRRRGDEAFRSATIAGLREQAMERKQGNRRAAAAGEDE